MSKIINQSYVTSKFYFPNKKPQILEIKSNPISTEYITESFKKIRNSSKKWATLNEHITFTITLSNNSDYILKNIYIQDFLAPELLFIDGSLKINDIPYPPYSPTQGFLVDTHLAPNEQRIITYQAKLISIPKTGQSNSFSQITYSVDNLINVAEFSNKTTIKATQNMIEITKTANKTVANHGDIIKFTNKITNLGTDLANTITFSDNIPKQSHFIPNSVTINQIKFENFDPVKGFNLDKLKENETIIIEYEVKIA